MKYEIINGVLINNKGKPIKNYRELPYGFGHFFHSNNFLDSLEGMVTTTSSRNNKPETILEPTLDRKNGEIILPYIFQGVSKDGEPNLRHYEVSTGKIGHRFGP